MVQDFQTGKDLISGGCLIPCQVMAICLIMFFSCLKLNIICFCGLSYLYGLGLCSVNASGDLSISVSSGVLSENILAFLFCIETCDRLSHLIHLAEIRARVSTDLEKLLFLQVPRRFESCISFPCFVAFLFSFVLSCFNHSVSIFL